jgi:hypothetical protein
MPLTPEVQASVKEILRKVNLRDRYSIEDNLTRLSAVDGPIRPYLGYLLRMEQNVGLVLLWMSSKRDDWAVRMLIERLEGHEDMNVAQRAWGSLRSMGKLPQEWRKPAFDRELWEACRTIPPEMPVRNKDGWRRVVKWNLLFKLFDDDLRDEAMDELYYIGSTATPGLLDALDEDDRELSTVALIMLRRQGDARAVDRLQQIIATGDDDDLTRLAQTALAQVETRPAPTVRRSRSLRPAWSREERQDWVREMAAPSLSGQFDPALERQVVRALLRYSAPDPDEKIAATQAFRRLGERITPILRHYAASAEAKKSRAARSILKMRGK